MFNSLVVKGLMRAAPLAVLLLGQSFGAHAQQPPPPIVGLGNAVVTGFSGTVAPDPRLPLPAGKTAVDLTLINPDGASARIVDLSNPGFIWDGRFWAAPKPRDILAKDTGQVFGVALDDQPEPNIYLAATSAFGLHIVRRGAGGAVERLRTGGPGAQWQNGQFGLALQGGPGSIYRVDGRTGAVSLFANVMLDGVPNPGTGLGGLAYDAAHQQLFVSDLYTGMIHRFSVADGAEAGPAFDHGVAGRGAARMAVVPFDPRNRPVITNPAFDSTNPATWGFAPPERRVWGLAVNGGRLYYSTRNGAASEGPQIWSVGIAQDGGFAGDPRWELDVPAQPGPYPVSDIAFSQRGAMILAQRAPIAGSYDYSAFTRQGEPRVLRYWLESPDDPKTPSRWIAVPEEYAVGFAGTFRNTNGGVALGYGYGQDARLVANACEYSLWTTGQNLRNDPARESILQPGGPLLVNGLAGMPAEPVRGFNEPPTTSYYVDYDDAFADPAASGHLGGVRIRTAPCAEKLAAGGGYGGPGYSSNPPYISNPSSNPVCMVNCGGLCEFGTYPDGSCVPPVETVDLAIEKKGGTTPQPEVNAYSFTLTITNTGGPFSAPANVITVTDVVPTGMTFGSATGTAGWTCLPLTVPSGGTLTCTYAGGLVPAGLVGTITITATSDNPPPFPEFKNCAQVGIAGGSGLVDTNAKNDKDCVTVKKPPKIDVAIKKTGKIVPVTDMPPAGVTKFDFSLDITNIGSGFTGSGAITVTDVVPASMSFNAVTYPSDWTCLPVVPPVLTAGNTLTCTYNGSGPVAPGDLLGSIKISAVGNGPGPWENCSNVAIAPATGTDANLDDNKSCVTMTKDGFDVVKDPPDLVKACGINVIFVVDVSSSIMQAGAAGAVTSALNNAKQLFNNVNSGGVQAQGEVITFSNGAAVLQPMSAATLTTPASLTFGGQTNWEAAMQLAYTEAQNSPTPVVIIFITDGIPNLYIDSSGNTVGTTDSVLATNEAIPWVNQIYGLGIPIKGIGIGSFSTHLNALLGTSSSSIGFNDLYSNLDGFARDMCPDLYLKKFMSPSSINYHNNPGPHQVTVTLMLQNTNGALTGVQVQDALPPELSNATSTDPNFSFAGGVVTWNIGNMNANTTLTLTFKADITPPSGLTCTWTYIPNYAQVTAVNEALHSVPNNMANAHTGPVHEHDEAASQIRLKDCDDPPPGGTPYLQVSKSSIESCYPTGQQGAVPAPPCTFTVTVTAVGNFTGNVEFADAVIPSSGSTPVSSSISSIVLTPPPTPSTQTYCATSFTSLPATCTEPNVTLNNGQSITYTITLGAPPPLAPGDYKQCFKAVQDTLPAAQHDWATYTSATPTTYNAYPWGYCGLFSVPGAAGLVAACPSNTRRVAGGGCVPTIVCRPPTVPNAAGTACVQPPPACQPPMVPGPVAGQCVCPPGTRQQGKECVPTIVCRPPLMPNAAGTACVQPPPACQPPMVPGPVAGQCVCPPGTRQQGKECVPTIVCRPPSVPNAAGTACVQVPPACRPPMVPGPVAGSCVCPEGTVQRGRECVRQITCRAPMIPNRAGTSCVCPAGTVQRGRECVRQIECKPPARPNRAGTACLCPEGTIARGRECVPERITPRLPPGIFPNGPRPNQPRDPRQDQRPDSPRGGGPQGPAGLR